MNENTDCMKKQALSGRLNFSTKTEILKIEQTNRWIRGYSENKIVVNSKQAKILWLKGRKIPIYCFQKNDIKIANLSLEIKTVQTSFLGQISYWNIDGCKKAAVEFTEPPVELKELKDHVILEWNAIERWFEEDEEVFVHLRDPYHRVDALYSTRKVKVVLAGVTIAHSENAYFLFETGFPTRYYIPKKDVSMDLLKTSDHVTRCPYKGNASYWSAFIQGEVYKDIAWEYTSPIEECPKIKGLICFYNEYVDAIFIDEQLEVRPKTVWSQLEKPE